MRQYLGFTLEIMWFLFLITCETHQLNAGSPAIRFATAYSATSIGLEDFRSFSFSQLVDPSFHKIRSCQPLVAILFLLVPFALVTVPSEIGIAVASSCDPSLQIKLNTCYLRYRPGIHVLCNYVRVILCHSSISKLYFILSSVEQQVCMSPADRFTIHPA